MSITVKQEVAPLQSTEVTNIRKKSATFDVKQHKFREQFRAVKPFQYDCETPYEMIAEVCQAQTICSVKINFCSLLTFF